MQGNRLLFLIIGVIVAVAAAVLWFLPRAERLRAPTLSAAWVGVEVGGDVGVVDRRAALEDAALHDLQHPPVRHVGLGHALDREPVAVHDRAAGQRGLPPDGQPLGVAVCASGQRVRRHDVGGAGRGND